MYNSNEETYPLVGGIYDHYKGGKYKVLSLAKHTETNETMVVYKSIHFGSVYVRPLDIWMSNVEIDKGFNEATEFVQRFRKSFIGF